MTGAVIIVNLILSAALLLILLQYYVSEPFTVQKGIVVGKAHREKRITADDGTDEHRLTFVPESYIIFVANCEGVEKIYVDKREYENTVIGQAWGRKL